MRSNFRSIALAAVLGCASVVPVVAKEQDAAPGVPEASRVPRLVLAISVDQLSADLFAEYRRFFTAGLKRLQEGAVFPSGFQSHAATETCPGHATLLTGVRPARSGIIANYWFDPAIRRADKRIYCSEDERDPRSTSTDPVISARHLKAQTLGDRLKAADRAVRNVAVSAKDRAAIMMGGHAIDQGYWWKDGAFTTLPGRKLAPEAVAANASAARLIAAGAQALPAPFWCEPRERAIHVGKRALGTGRFALDPRDGQGFVASPRGDAAVADLAIALAAGMKLGQGEATDVLSVSFSATDYIGHAFGTEGIEMCIQMAELDRTIGRLLDSLDGRGIDYVVALSADHGGFDLPERLAQQALPAAARVSAGLSPEELTAAVKAKTGIAVAGDLIYSDGPFGDFYVSRSLSPADRDRVLAALVEAVEAHPQVAQAFTAEQLSALPMPSGSPQDWTLAQRARGSFDRERSGDLVVLLKRGVVPIADPSHGAVATHGSPWDYDRRVPILFWRRGFKGMEQPAPVETIDIAPTLAALLRLNVAEGDFDGRCLDIDGSERNSCRPPQ